MPGLDDLMNFVMRAANVAPSYTAERCLAVTQSSTACHACVAVCPHEAVRLRRQVEIDEVECTGCGLCVQACPSQALEPKVTYQPGASVRCSRVGGTAQSVLCLGRLQPTDVLRLAGRHGEVTLAHGDCADCPIGTPAVLEALDRVAQDARALAAQHGSGLEIRVEQRDAFEADRGPAAMSRRALLTGGLRNAQRSASGALAPVEALLRLQPDPDEARPLPRELVRRYHMLRLARPEADDQVPWRLPRVADGCIMCPVCTRVCPTDAFSRDFDPKDADGPVLRLDPERCVGCDACVKACPVKVIEMDASVTWGELSGGSSIAYESDPERRSDGTVYR